MIAVIENVVLIDEADAALGEGEKLDVHRQGALHRAFSVFAFNAAGELLHEAAVTGIHETVGHVGRSARQPEPGRVGPRLD